jgi:hypothetical protein
MKQNIKAALEKLEAVAFDIRPGGRGEIEFKDAQVLLQGALDMPDPVAPKLPEITAQQLQDMGEKVKGMLEDMFVGVTTRLENVENATVALLDPVKATHDQLAGMEDVLGVIMSNTTPVPAA